eukprot:2605839-Pyramimonas_sp.AAC.1
MAVSYSCEQGKILASCSPDNIRENSNFDEQLKYNRQGIGCQRHVDRRTDKPGGKNSLCME